MPLKNGRLTPQERSFVGAQVAHGDPRIAARVAGYKHPEANGYAIAARPAVAAEVHRIQLERMTNKALPLAVDTIIKVMESTTAQDRAKLLAAKITLDFTLGRQEGSGGKEPHEMTASELQDSIDAARRRLAELSQPILEGEAVAVEDPAPSGDVFG